MCEGGNCNCVTHQSSVCVDRQIYWQDSCGNREELKEDCSLNDQYCINNQCVDRFNIIGDGTVRDNVSGLLWQQAPIDQDGREWARLDGATASVFCNAAYGFPWMLPISRELTGIKTGRAGECQLFPEFQGECSTYWGADSCFENGNFDPTRDVVVDFSDQMQANFCDGIHWPQHYVRCVKR